LENKKNTNNLQAVHRIKKLTTNNKQNGRRFITRITMGR
ncbi:MAG: hypothetical protein ACI8W0_002052, partial [Flavobacterium sp.]